VAEEKREIVRKDTLAEVKEEIERRQWQRESER
jgi:hypothetical protein